MPAGDCRLLSVLGSACPVNREGRSERWGGGWSVLLQARSASLCACGPGPSSAESKGRSASQKPHTRSISRRPGRYLGCPALSASPVGADHVWVSQPERSGASVSPTLSTPWLPSGCTAHRDGRVRCTRVRSACPAARRSRRVPLSRSLPEYFVVPSSLADQDLKTFSHSFVGRRMPVSGLCWESRTPMSLFPARH